MKKIFLIITAIVILFEVSQAQLPNYNMFFLANLNEHSSEYTYSGCWGYVAPDGSEYAILGTPLGTAFIDISNSLNIHEVDFATAPHSGVFNKWREITVYSHYAYVVTEQDSSGIEIFDLQYLPDSVHFVRRFIPERYSWCHTISQSGPYLYVNGANPAFGNGTTIFDLTSNPEMPVKRGSLNSVYVHDCRVVNDTIWAACLSNGIRIINAVDKNQLSLINSFLTPPHLAAHNCALTKDRKFILTTDESGIPTPSSLKIYNVQDLSSITFIKEWRPTNINTSAVHNVEIFGDTAVIAHRTAGIRLLDISNPYDPQEIAWYDTYPLNNNGSSTGCWRAYMFPSKKIICSNENDGLRVTQLGMKSLVRSNNHGTPNKFSLHQNFPNPFNPVTKINYELPASLAGGPITNYVTLKIYNALGSEMATLVNQRLVPGSYEVEFDGRNFSSGIYFYKLESNNFTEVKRMILLK